MTCSATTDALATLHSQWRPGEVLPRHLPANPQRKCISIGICTHISMQVQHEIQESRSPTWPMHLSQHAHSPSVPCLQEEVPVIRQVWRQGWRSASKPLQDLSPVRSMSPRASSRMVLTKICRSPSFQSAQPLLYRGCSRQLSLSLPQ